MTQNNPIYAFTAGEVAKQFYARKELTKYPLGVAFAKNFFVDYKGGLVTRPGSRMLNRAYRSSQEVRLYRFKRYGDDYCLVFGHEYMQVIRSGGYVLEDDIVITGISTDSPGVVTTDGVHNYSTGDWIFIYDVVGMTEVNGGSFLVGATTSNTLQLLDVDGNFVTTIGTYISDGVVNRVYTLVTPYQSEDLEFLEGEQKYGEMIFTHVDYARYKLTYTTDISWALNIVSSGSSIAAPTGLVGASDSAAAGTIYCVTAVDASGSESLPSPYLFMAEIGRASCRERV